MALFPSICPVCGKPTLAYSLSGVSCTNCQIYNTRLSLTQSVVIWTRNTRGWWWRAIILLVMAYWLQQYFDDDYFYSTAHGANPFNFLDFGIHELGHILFIPFGEFMTILGGSLFQCLFPLLWLTACLWKRWYFAATMMLVWFGYNLFDVAIYAADANVRLLPLATFSSDYDSAHDWFQILTRLHHLQDDQVVAGALRTFGTIFGYLGLALGSTLIFLMARNAKTSENKTPPVI